MKSLRYLLGNGLWTLANTKPWLRYRRAVRNPRRAQEQILFSFLRKNTDSAYGRKYHYAQIKTVGQFQNQVPIVTYDDLQPWIDQIYQGKQQVLTTEPVLMMEKTSGSSGAAKFIPYTDSLRKEFQQAIGAWMFDLFTRRSLAPGAQYWSLSPLAREKERTPGGLPIGFDQDTEYFGWLEQIVLKWVMAVPGEIVHIPDIEENRRITLQHLIKCPQLRFISVWNPSFLTILLSRLPPGARPLDYWPRLKLISCWTSVAAARFVPELQEWFPGVEIQGKGLLATEGVVSFPEIGRPAPSPAITSHFLEFLGEDNKARLVDELEVGKRYRPLITTGAGFARYSLGDLIEVIAPNCIELVGRADQVSDLCGEKLSEAFVETALDETARKWHLNTFMLLAPEWGRPPRYVLYIESTEAESIARDLEQKLQKSVHYQYCRQLGQLLPVEGVSIRNGNERFLAGCQRRGQRAGDIKPASLRSELDWRKDLSDICPTGS